MDFNELRELFPVTKKYVFLNNAAESPLNLCVYEKINDYLEVVLNAPHHKPSIRDTIRNHLADLLGGQPSEYAPWGLA